MLKQLLFGFTLAAMTAGVAPISNATETDLESQISNERGVKVTVTPQNISMNAKTWNFEVKLETHTRDLGEDLAKSSVLVADGKKYAPIGWEGAPPGGHHRKGKLSFNAIVPQPASMELQIRLTSDLSPRSFKWLLK